MRVTSKGQITIPQDLRKKYGITSETEVEFSEENGKIYLRKTGTSGKTERFTKVRGSATVKMSTDEIMALTRGDE